MSNSQLEQKEARLRAIVDAIPHLVCQVHRDGRFTVVKTGRQFFPLQTIFDSSARFMELLPPQQAASVQTCLDSVLAGRAGANCEINVAMGGRRTRAYEIRMAAVAQDEALAFARDVTRRRRAEARRAQMQLAIERSAKEWRLTFDAIDAQVLILGQKGLIHRMNQATLQDLGGSYRDWIGRPASVLRGRQPWDRVLQAAADSDGHPIFEEVTDPDTLRTWVCLCRSTILPEADQLSMVVVVREITKLVELQDSLRRSDAMATVGSLVAGVAHEVRNPLFAISAIVHAWSLKGEQADSKRYLAMLTQEVGRLRTLMNDLLEYAKPCDGIRAPVSIRAVVNEAVQACEPLANTGGMRIAASVADSLAVMDRQRVARVFVNLIENALQHSPPGTTVTVEGGVEVVDGSPQLQISVRDEGPGFVPARLADVFRPFFSTRKGGTGLGLAIVRRIIDDHHGRVVAENLPGGGGTVKVFLPVDGHLAATKVSPAARIA